MRRYLACMSTGMSAENGDISAAINRSTVNGGVVLNRKYGVQYIQIPWKIYNLDSGE
jgi:hypothetical protein